MLRREVLTFSLGTGRLLVSFKNMISFQLGIGKSKIYSKKVVDTMLHAGETLSFCQEFFGC